MSAEKVCKRCAATKPETEFYKVSGRRPELRRAICRTCERARVYRYRGLTPPTCAVGLPGNWHTRRKEAAMTAKQLRLIRHLEDPDVRLYKEAVACPKRQARKRSDEERVRASVQRLLVPVDWIRQRREHAPSFAAVRQAAHEDESGFAPYYEGRTT